MRTAYRSDNTITAITIMGGRTPSSNHPLTVCLWLLLGCPASRPELPRRFSRSVPVCALAPVREGCHNGGGGVMAKELPGPKHVLEEWHALPYAIVTTTKKVMVFIILYILPIDRDPPPKESLMKLLQQL